MTDPITFYICPVAVALGDLAEPVARLRFMLTASNRFGAQRLAAGATFPPPLGVAQRSPRPG